MISQSDIIKILVQRNCTEESVMSTANSPNCSVTQLLEKLIDIERFDLAQDISMKLGLDVTPICKTWAIRCLSGKNFTMAREKFRYCFKRLCPPGNRKSHLQTKLLTDIIDELRKLDEKPIILVEKVELIKHGIFINPSSSLAMTMARNSFTSTHSNSFTPDHNNQQQLKSDATGLQKPIHLKPSILAECRYYLKEYGNICDLIKFNVENHLWDDLVKTLSENIDSNKIDQLFLSEVVPYVLSTGNLSKLIQAFQRKDGFSVNHGLYIKSMYGFCARNRRYNTLYYIQSAIGDLLAAANTQLRYFFLIKPIEGYRELNQRLSNLKLALKNYREYLEKCKGFGAEDNGGGFDSLFTDGDTSPELLANEKNDKTLDKAIFLKMTVSQVERKIYTIERQIDITVNFALNEVSGLMLQDVWTCGPNLSFSPAPLISGWEDQMENSIVFINDNNNQGRGTPLNSTSNPLPDHYSFSSSPVTLFDQSKLRKTYLAALVLIFYDLSCGSYFSRDGLRLANDLISVYGLNQLIVYKIAMRILLEEEGCDIIKNASLLLECIRYDIRSRGKGLALSRASSQTKEGAGEAAAPTRSAGNADKITNDNPFELASSGTATCQQQQAAAASSLSQLPSPVFPEAAQVDATSALSAHEAGRAICDEVLRDSIASCREPDYKMELAKLLSNEAKIELYIEIGKLSNAQMLACNLNRPDYVSSIIEKASELNQNHVKTVCQLWLAKHETKKTTTTTTTTKSTSPKPTSQRLQTSPSPTSSASVTPFANMNMIERAEAPATITPNAHLD